MRKNMATEIGARIALALARLDKTQAWLAAQADIDECSVSDYVRGKHSPSGPRLAAMARVLGVTTDYLCGLSSDMGPSADEDFGTILNCALRYALGRRTYMVGIVSKYINDHIDKLDKKTIGVMITDIEQCAAKGGGALGHECDLQDWMWLLDALKTAYAQGE